MPRQEIDIGALFLQSATLMSSGFFLIIIGKPTCIFVIGIVLLVACICCLITAFLQIWGKFQKYTQFVKRLGDDLTILFIMIATLTVAYGWVAIKNIKAADKLSEVTSGQQLEPFRQALITGDFFVYLIVAFWIVYDIVLLCDMAKQDTRAERIGHRKILVAVFVILCIAAIIGISTSTDSSSIRNGILLGLCILLVVGMLYHMIKLRSAKMDEKERIRKTAIAIETTADLIDKFLKLPHSPEILKETLKVPLKQLEDELQSLSHDVDALK